MGITDDGVDLDHADLAANVFTHPGEIPGNGIDDDSNGYIDDVNGWDFVFANNDPNPNSAGDDHGTHVAGIAGARTNNGVGVAGTAGGSTLLPLQFFSSGQPWTAAIIAETFAYAVDNGAHITSTSYNINGWVGDPVFTAGLQYLYDQGGMHFNSAGNGSELNPARQAFEQTFLVVSTNSADVKSGFSNYGSGCDISTPGESIFSTVLNDLYGTKSGTSMAAPNAAGVAALIWSHNPGWTRDQVAAQLMATADDIDGNNPGLEGLLGAGRANSFRALTEVLAAPRVLALTGIPADGTTTQDTDIGSFSVAFDQILDPASVNTSTSYDLRESGADGLFDTGDDQVRMVTGAKTYMLSTNQMEFDIAGGPLGLGSYRLSLTSGGLENPFGTDLDGDGDGSPGDDFVSFFRIGLERVAPAGSLVYRWVQSSSIDVPSEIDSFEVNLDPDQTLTVLVVGATGLTPSVEVRDSVGTLLAFASSGGTAAGVQALPITTPGLYEVMVYDSGGSTGAYTLSLVLNALLEEEPVSGVPNDSAGSAEDLERGALALGTGLASRLSVLGQAGFGENFESGSVGLAWSLSSSMPEGRIQVTDEYGGASGSAFALLMDLTQSGPNNLNEAVWEIDLSSVSGPVLTFHHAEWADEENALPLSFVGSADGDGVSISEDGTIWHRIFNPASQTAGVWQPVTVDLVIAAANAGITLGSTFQIKFQQFDNFPLPTDGRGYDEISITSTSEFEDWYRFELRDGQSATLGVANAAGPTGLDLFAGDGSTLLASGVTTANLTSAIERFQDATANGVVDTYYARVTANLGEYDLLVTRSATFDIENNGSPSLAQDLTGFGTVLGNVESGLNDYYFFDAVEGETILLRASLPGGGPLHFMNTLAPGGQSALRMALFEPGGSLVVTGVQALTHVAETSGTYGLIVFGAGGASGEYVISRTVRRKRLVGQTPVPVGF